MKAIIKIVIITTVLFFMSGCEDPGVTVKRLNGFEDNLPFELRGLKVYSVSLGEGNWVKVAIIDDKVNSLTYSVGKVQETTIVINNGNRIVNGTIISENDSIIVIKK
jgi:hypothetical protein